MTYAIMTTGAGMLPAGVVVGMINAESVKEAKKRLSKQCPEHWFDTWSFIPWPN